MILLFLSSAARQFENSPASPAITTTRPVTSISEPVGESRNSYFVLTVGWIPCFIGESCRYDVSMQPVRLRATGVCSQPLVSAGAFCLASHLTRSMPQCIGKQNIGILIWFNQHIDLTFCSVGLGYLKIQLSLLVLPVSSSTNDCAFTSYVVVHCKCCQLYVCSIATDNNATSANCFTETRSCIRRWPPMVGRCSGAEHKRHPIFAVSLNGGFSSYRSCHQCRPMALQDAAV